MFQWLIFCFTPPTFSVAWLLFFRVMWAIYVHTIPGKLVDASCLSGLCEYVPVV